MGNESSASAEDERDVVDSYLVPSDFPNNTRQILLHDACLKNNKSFAEFLHTICVRYPEDAAELLKKKDGLQCLPFHYAIAGGHIDAVTALAEKYVEFKIFPSKADLVNHPVENGATSLHIAIVARHIDIVHSLISMGADVKHETAHHASPLHIACVCGSVFAEGGSLEIVKLLVGLGAPINKRTLSNDSPLEAAATATVDTPQGITQQEDIVLFLMSQPGVNLELKGEDAPSLIHEAAERGYCRVFQSLIQSDSSNLELIDKCGNGPIHIASKAGKIEIVKLLLENKASPDLLNAKLETPLFIAVGLGNLELTTLLVSSGANVNHSTDEGSILCVACRLESPDILTYLLTQGANANLTDVDQNTPLHIASQTNHHKVARGLLEPLQPEAAKNYVNAKNKSGLTPLHLAATSGHHKIVEILLHFGANINEATPTTGDTGTFDSTWIIGSRSRD